MEPKTNLRDKEIYLGDGLYASFDGFQIILRAPRGYEDHYVMLDPSVFDALMEYGDKIYDDIKKLSGE